MLVQTHDTCLYVVAQWEHFIVILIWDEKYEKSKHYDQMNKVLEKLINKEKIFFIRSNIKVIFSFKNTNFEQCQKKILGEQS